MRLFARFLTRPAGYASLTKNRSGRVATSVEEIYRSRMTAEKVGI